MLYLVFIAASMLSVYADTSVMFTDLPLRDQRTLLVSTAFMDHIEVQPDLIMSDAWVSDYSQEHPTCSGYRFHRDKTVLTPRFQILYSVFSNVHGHKVVAIAGMHRPKHIETVANFKPAKCPFEGECGRIHAGFLQAYLSFKEDLLQRFEKAKQITLVGHSMGAALALIAAYDFKRMGLPVTRVVAMGAPRIGTRQFEASFERVMAETPVYRIILHGNQQRDFITRLPPRILSYRSGSKRVILDGTGLKRKYQIGVKDPSVNYIKDVEEDVAQNRFKMHSPDAYTYTMDALIHRQMVEMGKFPSCVRI